MKASHNYAGSHWLMADRAGINATAARFPMSWVSRITGAIARQLKETPRWEAERNRLWHTYLDRLMSADKGGLAPDASDGDICQAATDMARDFGRRIQQLWAIAERGARHAAMRARFGLGIVPFIVADYCRELLAARDLADMWPKGRGITRAGAIKRMSCERFWRRVLRALHARSVEACAIALGLVHKNAGLYCSHDAVKRRAGQSARNAAALSSVMAVNDHAQAFTLAELAAKGTANKAIRRAELMTRIAGFDLIAQDLGHEGMMLSLTCPSRMHKMTTAGNGWPVENKKWDGTTPRAAQQYLSACWARMRAAAAREHIEWYGFRVTEPQQDGTPHWHVLLFHAEGQGGQIEALARRYFLHNDSADERGAAAHRVDRKIIDRSKGSAAAYVAKYISKNIDGYGVGQDMFGNDAVTSSQRVDAWASTWRIRQFQQVGGPPVTVWRELRRLHPDNLQQAGPSAVGQSGDLPEALKSCVIAMNLRKTEPGLASAAWKRYVNLQGGPCASRAMHTVSLCRQSSAPTSMPSCLNRYGETMALRIVGVRASGLEMAPAMEHLRVLLPHLKPASRRVSATVESERAEWVTVPTKDRDRAVSLAVLAGGAAARPWTRVNNCTPTTTADGSVILESRINVRGEVVPETVSAFRPRVVRRPKLRKFMNWGAA